MVGAGRLPWREAGAGRPRQAPALQLPLSDRFPPIRAGRDFQLAWAVSSKVAPAKRATRHPHQLGLAEIREQKWPRRLPELAGRGLVRWSPPLPPSIDRAARFARPECRSPRSMPRPSVRRRGADAWSPILFAMAAWKLWRVRLRCRRTCAGRRRSHRGVQRAAVAAGSATRPGRRPFPSPFSLANHGETHSDYRNLGKRLLGGRRRRGQAPAAKRA